MTKKSTAYRIFVILFIGLCLSMLGSDCNGDEEDDAIARPPFVPSDDDDGDYYPPPNDDADDDIADDDTADDDTGDDDTDDDVNDDTGDDDTGDDDTDDDVNDDVDDDVDDDVNDDVDDDIDDDVNDDVDDDDTTPPTTTTIIATTTTTTTTLIDDPYVTINEPTNSTDLDGYYVDVQADIGNADVVVVTMENREGIEDITHMLSITGTEVVGSLYIEAGQHTLEITVSDEARASASDSVTFNMDMGKVIINFPSPGALYSFRDILIDVDFINMAPLDMHVKVDDLEWTDSLQIGGDRITGEMLYVLPGDHNLHVWGYHPNHVDLDLNPEGIVEAWSYFSIELQDPHIDILLDTNTIFTGEQVHYEYLVIDGEGQDRTSEVVVELDISPVTGTIPNEVEQNILFAQPGMFEVKLFTILDGSPVEGSVFVWVTAMQPWKVEIEVSSHTVQAGDQISSTYQVYDENDQPIWGSVFYSAWPSFGTTIEQGLPTWITFERAGEIAIRGTVDGTGVFDEEIVTVTAGVPVELDIHIPEPVINEGGVTHPIVFLKDEYGNIVEEVEAVFTVFPGREETDWDIDTPAAGDITIYTGGVYMISAAAVDYLGVNDSDYIHVMDITPPQIELYSPERGQWVNDPDVYISGIVHGCNPVTDRIQYTGEESDRPVASDCTFEHTMILQTGINIVEIKVTEESGNVAKAAFARMKGNKLADGEQVDSALRFRINECGFGEFGYIIMPTLQEVLDQLPEMLYAMNPIFDEEIEFWGLEIASARADVRQVEIGEPYINLDSVQDVGINLKAGVKDILLGFRVRGRIIGISYQISGEIGFDEVNLSAKTDIFTDENDHFTVDIYDLRLGLLGFNFDINDFPDELESWFEDDIQSLMENIIGDILTANVPPLLQDLLDQLPQDFTFELLGNDFAVDYTIDNILWDDTGGSFYMDMGISTPGGNPSVPDFGGSIQTPGTAPAHSEIGMYVPGTESPYSFGILLADDFLNQALYVLYKTGMISQDFDAVFDTDNGIIGLVFPDLATAYPGAQVNISLRPMLPPVLVVATQQRGAITDSNGIPVEFQIGDMIVSMFVDDGQEHLFLEMAVNLIMPAAMGIKFPDNTIQLDIHDPVLYISVIREPLMDFDDALFEDIGPLLVDLLLPLIGGLLEGIPLPTFDDYGFYVLEEMIMGPSSDYVGIFAEIVQDYCYHYVYGGGK